MVRLLVTALAISLLAGCGLSPTTPFYASTSQSNIAPDRRGAVKLFPDTFGDPVPTGIVTGPDGALWFTDSGNALIGRITKRGKYTLQMPAGAEVSDGITVGPDKNLWFTVNQSSAEIGRITTGGKVRLFSDGGGAYPQGITLGPDGALWIAESNGTVGRMTTKGSVTHFTVAPSNAELEGIVTGPDGNLWVTQYVVGSRFSDVVIRLTTGGQHTAFTVGFGPKFICVGPDKALWFAETSANAIGRITTAGRFKDFPTGYKYAQPSGIATGSDGALWFTDFSGRAGIGRMTTKGAVKYYKVPGSFPELVEIARGPDSRMWFTSDLGPSGIGRIEP
ncbi:MAG: Virginiamycin B lyase [Candidatus Eremiobacteraeota bacterium]|nr:Virginiamycin B lyase [Candidatus Eremiobacteraeota bacterium]